MGQVESVRDRLGGRCTGNTAQLGMFMATAERAVERTFHIYMYIWRGWQYRGAVTHVHFLH